MSTLENASAVLKLFAHGQGAMPLTPPLALSFSDVARRLSLPKSTLSRLLMSMEDQGLLARNPESRLYSIGDLLLAVGNQSAVTSLEQIAAGVLRQLSAENRCGGLICTLDRDQVMVVDIFQGSLPQPLPYSLGQRLPAAQTAVGRALLSCYSGQEVIDRLAPGVATYGAFSQPGLTRLMQRIERVRHQGWCYARDEFRPGQSALATSLNLPHRLERLGLCMLFPSLSDRHDFPHELLAGLNAARAVIGDRAADESWGGR